MNGERVNQGERLFLRRLGQRRLRKADQEKENRQDSKQLSAPRFICGIR